ncbi:MAG: tetraacyldisaccharide 4'-kinase [Terriglobia bacterium]
MLLIQHLLTPLGWIYAGLIRFRLWLYATGLKSPSRLRKPVICVGNLTMGGTGKTPCVIVIGRLLQEQGYRVSVILRGYKGRHHGPPLLVSNGTSLLATSEQAGDEALLIAKNLPEAVVAVSKDRKSCGDWVENNFPVDVHLLDDGYQHLPLFRNFNLLLLDVTNPFGGGFPPMGRLREPLSGIKRADAILLTRTKLGESYDSLIQELRRHRKDLPLFYSRQKIYSVDSLPGDATLEPVQFRDTRLLAFAGIGNPSQFFSLLKESQFCILQTCAFPDHHRYTSRDVSTLKSLSKKIKSHGMITTEKDAQNLSLNDFPDHKVWVAKLEFELEDPVTLLDFMLRKLGTKISPDRMIEP